MERSPAEDETAVSTLQVRLPPFWAKNPRAWFAQVEAQFHLKRINAQLSRYYYIVSALPPEIADQFDDVLAATPPADAYDHLKATILRRKTESTSSRLQRLLTTEELGDQRPSQLLHRMRQLLGEQVPHVENPILRELFLQRLPQGIRMVLASATDMPLDRLAEMADRVAEYAAPTISTLVEPPPSSTALQDLQLKIDQLTASVAALQPPSVQLSISKKQRRAICTVLRSRKTLGEYATTVRQMYQDPDGRDFFESFRLSRASSSNLLKMGKLLQTAVCINFMKLLLMTFNVIFGVMGMVLLILGVWMNASLYHFLRLSADYNQHMPLVFIVTGIVVVVVSILACIGTAKGQSAILYIFGGVLILVFLAELTAGIVGYVYIRQVKEGIGRGMNSSMVHYGAGGMSDETVDFVQNNLGCCGLMSAEDWLATGYYKGSQHFPKSCCSAPNVACTAENLTLRAEDAMYDPYVLKVEDQTTTPVSRSPPNPGEFVQA
ncbi:tetraspanin-6 [Ixodes scapularis]